MNGLGLLALIAAGFILIGVSRALGAPWWAALALPAAYLILAALAISVGT